MYGFYDPDASPLGYYLDFIITCPAGTMAVGGSCNSLAKRESTLFFDEISFGIPTTTKCVIFQQSTITEATVDTATEFTAQAFCAPIPT